MSVKYERKSRINSSVQVSHDNNHNYQVINCFNNKLQLHRRLIETYAINLDALCVQKTIAIQNKTVKSKFQREQLSQKHIQRNSPQFSLSIQGTNLYVTKALVKHTFGLDKFLEENIQFLRFQIPQSDMFVIQNYSFPNPTTKVGLKVILASDENGLCQRSAKYSLIKPLDLIEENMRIRAQKLNRSNCKSFNIQNQSTKKLNLKWNTQASFQSPTKDCRQSNLRIKRMNSIGNISQNIQIRGVEYKKSVEKLDRNKSRSFSRVQKNVDIKKGGMMNMLQKSKNIQSSNRLNSSMKGKYLNNSSFFERKREESFGYSNSKKNSIDNIQNQLSSQSYYTAKKEIDKEIEIPQRIQPKKFTQVTTSKQNSNKKVDSRTSCKNISKLGSTINELRNARESESNKIMSMNSSINLDGKKFNKNICQAKIAQISRTLLTDTKNTLSTHNINLIRNQK